MWLLFSLRDFERGGEFDGTIKTGQEIIIARYGCFRLENQNLFQRYLVGSVINSYFLF